MDGKEISLVLGTAGHIDHGKTTLVKALTGVDCDRLSEEKKRGITIELGFAPLKLDDGRIVSIVDVPGHERFIRQMVAGASGVDAILLVVAADEGVMPQTREHLDILRLLGVHDGLVAVTKTDTVEGEFLDMVLEDIKEFVDGTFLQGKPVIPVSAFTGTNIPDLRRELARLVDRVPIRPRRGPFFLPVDRAFPVLGFGTVVTGTAYRGTIHAGAEGIVLPSEKKVRIRSVQVHGTPVEAAWAGQRVAASLSGLSSGDLTRGDTLCAEGIYRKTQCFECEIHLLSRNATPLRHWQRVRLHIGTSDVMARVSLLDRANLQPGDRAPGQIVAEEDVVCLMDQRFILRRYSPLETIGGGWVLGPSGTKPKGKKARQACIERISAMAQSPLLRDRLAALVRSYGRVAVDECVAFLQEFEGDVLAAGQRLDESGDVVLLQGERRIFLSPETFAHLHDTTVRFLTAFHEEHPSQSGTPADEATLTLFRDLEPRTAKALLDAMVKRGDMAIDEGRLRLRDFVPRDDAAFARDSEALLSLCDARGFQPPLIDECRSALGVEEKKFSALVKTLKDAGAIAIVAGGFILSSRVEKKLLKVLSRNRDDITLAGIRDSTGSSRKFILPILESFDARGYTRRVGDKRVLILSKLPESLRPASECDDAEI